MPSKQTTTVLAHQRLLRAVNDELIEVVESSATDFLCECATAECLETIPVPVSEYQRLRRDAATFVVAPGHHDERRERVVEEHAGWLVVETNHPDLIR